MLPNQQIITALLKKYTSDLKTGFTQGNTITYSFMSESTFNQWTNKPDPTDAKKYPLAQNDPLYQQHIKVWEAENGTGFGPADPGLLAMVEKGFKAWETFLNVKFEKDKTGNGQIRFGTADLGPINQPNMKGYNNNRSSYGNSTALIPNYIVLEKSIAVEKWAPGKALFETLLHEIGHALGLDHPGNNQIRVGNEDNRCDTIMSLLPIGYTDIRDGYGSVLSDGTLGFLTPSRYDIAALQQEEFLGVNKATAGNNTPFVFENPISFSKVEYKTIFDAGGNDDYIDASRITTQTWINLEPGTASTIGVPVRNNGTPDDSRNIVIAFGTVIENVIGGSNSDVIYGNDAANKLEGRGGNDTLWGGGKGNDTLIGGDGEDTYLIKPGDETVHIQDSGKNFIEKDGKRYAGAFTKDKVTGKYIFLGNDVISGESVTMEFHSPGVLEFEDGTKVIFDNQTSAEDFKDGDFGFRLFENTAQDTASTINGDLRPVDTNPDVEGEQGQEDQWGNLVPTTDADAGREDYLFDTSANDLICGQAGDDILVCKWGGNDRLEGGGGDDGLNGGGGNDLLLGGTGTDQLLGGGGNDLLYAYEEINLVEAAEQGRQQTGSGQKGDWLNGENGDDILVGNVGDDMLFGGTGGDLLIGGAGNDCLDGDDDYVLPSNGYFGHYDWTVGETGNPFDHGYGQAISHNTPAFEGGNDVLYGGAGNDFLTGLKGNDLLFGEGDNDTLAGCDNDDLLFGGSGDDKLTGDYGKLAYDSGAGTVIQGNDYLDGGEGNDWLQGEGGDDRLYGGVGNDELWGDAKTYNAPDLNGNDILDGEDGNDELHGQGGDDELTGGAGDDTLYGDAGNDTLDGGTGNDTLAGGAGQDIYLIDGNDKILDEDKDSIIQFAGTQNAQAMTVSMVSEAVTAGADPVTWLTFTDTATGTSLNILGGELGGIAGYAFADGSTLSHREMMASVQSDGLNLVSGNDNNCLIGTRAGDTLTGGKGNDTLEGGGGDDIYLLQQGDGQDQIIDYAGNNVLRFGEGITADSIVISNGMYLGAEGSYGQYATIRYGSNGDVVRVKDGAFQGAIDRLEFADGSTLSWEDAISGQAAMDIQGSDGDDRILGTNQNDQLAGNGGDDILIGNGGNDYIEGGKGDDVLEGGEGCDIYRFCLGSGKDTIIEADGGNNLLRFESWQSASSLRAEQEGDDLKLFVRGSGDSITLKDYYAGGAQNWTVDFDGNDAVTIETIMTQPDEMAGSVESFWNQIKNTLIEETIWSAEHSTQYIEQLGGNVGWKNLGNLSFEVQGQEATLCSVNRQITTTYYYGISGEFISSNQEDATSVDIGNWSYSRSNPLRSFQHYEITRIESNDGLIENLDTTRSETGFGTAIATLAFGGTKYDYQQWTSNSHGFVLDSQGTLMMNCEYRYDHERYSQVAYIQAYNENTAGWNAPYNTLVGNQVAVEYVRFDEYSPLVTEVIAGDGDNVVYANSSATEFVDGGRGNDTIYGGDGALGYGDVLYGNDGDDDIYSGSVLPSAWGVSSAQADYGTAMIGGNGNDRLYGGDGADHYLSLSRDEEGVDWIEDWGGYDRENLFQAWYYQQHGIENNAMRGENDCWALWPGSDGTYFQTFEEAVEFIADRLSDRTVDDLIASGELVYIPPLPTLRLGNAKDFRLAESLAGVIAEDYRLLLAQDRVELPPGIAPDDLTFGWSTPLCEDDMVRPVLEVGWDGMVRLTIVMPRADDPLGYGIEQFAFADGSILTMSDIIDRAPPMPDIGDGTLVGNGESNTLLAAQDGSSLFGMSGDDALIGASGADTLNGGYGNDVQNGGAGNDVYVFRRGDGQDRICDNDTTEGNVDTVFFDQSIMPDDVTVSCQGNDLVLTIAGGTDRLILSDWARGSRYRIEQIEFIDGTVWNTDVLADKAGIVLSGDTPDEPHLFTGTSGNDLLMAGEGDDTLIGGDGDDVLAGGTGDDIIEGGAGDDTYVFNLGDGVDSIDDISAAGAGNTILFGEGISEDMLRLDIGSLLIHVGEGGDAIHLGNFDPDDVLALRTVETFRFADGSSLSYEELLERGFDLNGTAGDDVITGTNIDDRIAGGAGDDELVGNAGSDVYSFGRGDGNDLIYDEVSSNEINTLRFKEGIAAADIVITREGDDLLLSVADTQDSIRISGGATGNAINRVEFADGEAWSQEVLLTYIPAANTPPVLQTPIPDQAVTENLAFSFTVPTDTFIDVDAGDVLGYTATLANGDALPDWLQFDAESGTFSGTPGAGDVGALEINVIATDIAGSSAESSFVLNIAEAANQAPVLVTPLADLVLQKNAFTFWQIPTGSFADADLDDTLTLTATLADGSALPDWLGFDAETQSFYGYVPANAKGTFDIRVTASDGNGADSIASDIFSVSFGSGDAGVGNGEDPPPPGHDGNFNDGCGTGPGKPGAQGGHGANDQDSGGHGENNGHHGKGKDKDDQPPGFSDENKPFAYLKLDHVEQHWQDFGVKDKAGNEETQDRDFYRRWAEMNKALARDDETRHKRDGWSDSRGADVRPFGLIAAGFLGGNQETAADPISLVGDIGLQMKGSGTLLKGFTGLHEGLRRLS